MERLFEDTNEKELRKAMSKFVETISDHTALITITRVRLNDRKTVAHVLFTVLPTEHEVRAQTFLQRHQQEARDYLKKHTRRKILPGIRFEIDAGEKKRQHIDELLRE